jgi:hypothetical protein
VHKISSRLMSKGKAKCNTGTKRPTTLTFFSSFFFSFVPLCSFEAGRLALAQVFWFSSFCASTELGWQLAHEASVPMVISGRLRTGAYLA